MRQSGVFWIRFAKCVKSQLKCRDNMEPNVPALTLPAIGLKMSSYYGCHRGIDQNMNSIADCYIHDNRVWVTICPNISLITKKTLNNFVHALTFLAIAMLPHSRKSPIGPSPKYAPKGVIAYTIYNIHNVRTLDIISRMHHTMFTSILFVRSISFASIIFRRMS